MGQKVSPIGLRLGITHKHQSQWFVDPRNGAMKKNYPSLILEDRFIRNFLIPKFPRSAIAQILIFRTLDYIKIEIHTAPAKNLSLLSSNKKNSDKSTKERLDSSKVDETHDNSSHNLNLKTLQEELGQALQNYKRKTLSLLFSNPRRYGKQDQTENNSSEPSSVAIGIMVKQLAKPFQSASVFAKYLATQLEKRENTVKQALNRSLRLIQNDTSIQGIKIRISGRLNGVDMAEQESIFRGRVPLSSILANIDYCYETSNTLYGILGVKVWIYREDE